MRKRDKDNLEKFWDKIKHHLVTKIILFLLGIGILILIQYLPSPEGTVAGMVLGFIKDKVTLSALIAFIYAFIRSVIIDQKQKREEERNKTEDDQKKIIRKYDGYKYLDIDNTKNYYSEVGTYMGLHNLLVEEKRPKIKIKDKHSKKYKEIDEELSAFYNKEKPLLLIPNLNIYTNCLLNTTFKVKDSEELYKLNDFIIFNSNNLLSAHKNSSKSNNATIRLNYISSIDENTIELNLMRSNYFQMLITNRCMDYKLTDGMSLRDVYEYKNKVSPLKESPFGNQIGMTGLIITKDGYLLIEHRTLKKSTWKDKFAQPISLAFKVSDVFSKDELNDGNNIITDSNAESKFMGVIKKTLKTNFNLIENEDYDSISLKSNFFGIARDLLEGGKPNFYFFVQVNYDAEEFVKKLQEYSNLIVDPNDKNNKRVTISQDKLKNKYYLVNYSDIKLSFEYEMIIRKNKAYKINRKYSPRFKHAIHKNTNKVKAMNRNLRKECGESLLVCFSYLEIMEDKIL